MGLLHFHSLPVLILLLAWSFCLPLHLKAQESSISSITSRRALDSLLQEYSFKAFVNPRTGIIYDGQVPSNLTGISVAGVRLRSGSLRYRGVEHYKEFEIPVGVVEEPYQERLVLVYQNLGNWSDVYYPLPNHTYLSPVLGLLAYSAANFSAKNLPPLDLRAYLGPILIHYSDVARSADSLPRPRCVWFDLNGATSFSDLVSNKTCATTQEGHYALVAEGVLPAPAPAPVAPAPLAPPSPDTHEKDKGKHISSKVWIIIGSVAGGLVLFILMAMLLICLGKYKQKKKMQGMERAADSGEVLRQTTVGSARAPAAFTTRTQPTLETEYVP